MREDHNAMQPLKEEILPTEQLAEGEICVEEKKKRSKKVKKGRWGERRKRR